MYTKNEKGYFGLTIEFINKCQPVIYNQEGKNLAGLIGVDFVFPSGQEIPCVVFEFKITAEIGEEEFALKPVYDENGICRFIDNRGMEVSGVVGYSVSEFGFNEPSIFKISVAAFYVDCELLNFIR